MRHAADRVDDAFAALSNADKARRAAMFIMRDRIQANQVLVTNMLKEMNDYIALDSKMDKEMESQTEIAMDSVAQAKKKMKSQ